MSGNDVTSMHVFRSIIQSNYTGLSAKHENSSASESGFLNKTEKGRKKMHTALINNEK